VVAQVTVRSSARNEAASASLILICSRRLTLAILRGSIARRPPCGLLSIALARTRPRAIPGPRDRTDAAALVPSPAIPTMTATMSSRLAVWTVGHSNHEFEEFARLVLRERIEVLVDVRSFPYSRYAPHRP
jgi:hypothetical protein